MRAVRHGCLAHDRASPTPSPACRPMQAAMLPVACRTSAQQDADGEQAQERIGDPQRIGEGAQRAGEQRRCRCCQLTSSALDAHAREEMQCGVHHGGQHDGGPRARLALDRGEHRAAQEGLFDQRHGESAQYSPGARAFRTWPPSGAAPPCQSRRPSAAMSRMTGSISATPSSQRLDHLAHENGPRQAVAEARAVRDADPARHAARSPPAARACRCGWRCGGREIEVRMQQRARPDKRTAPSPRGPPRISPRKVKNARIGFRVEKVRAYGTQAMPRCANLCKRTRFAARATRAADATIAPSADHNR